MLKDPTEKKWIQTQQCTMGDDCKQLTEFSSIHSERAIIVTVLQIFGPHHTFLVAIVTWLRFFVRRKEPFAITVTRLRPFPAYCPENVIWLQIYAIHRQHAQNSVTGLHFSTQSLH